VLGIKEASKLVPIEDDMKPVDPVTENQAVLRGKPVKAFLHQDHKAHIAVHTAPMQDPTIMQLIGQNPKAPMIQSAMMAHIAEHVGFAYRQQIEQQMGVPLPPEDEKLPPEIEVALSAMMAQAAVQVSQQNQAQAAQQQAQQQAQDPVVQMQQQELQIKQGELALKERKLQVDAAAKADEPELKQQALDSKMELEGFKAGQQAQQTERRLQGDQERDGMRMGADIAKNKTQAALQAAQMLANPQKGNKPK